MLDVDRLNRLDEAKTFLTTIFAGFGRGGALRLEKHTRGIVRGVLNGLPVGVKNRQSNKTRVSINDGGELVDV